MKDKTKILNQPSGSYINVLTKELEVNGWIHEERRSVARAKGY